MGRRWGAWWGRVSAGQHPGLTEADVQVWLDKRRPGQGRMSHLGRGRSRTR